ncbi:hypothetical protein CDD82_454 [Ophiocordyceps australis]|uniref:Uncharacterized protein n=1 Tax=Ophiocordyceps australis TaxID=1399860 RepID=A0A2C5YTY2_9HYPO|nr:hypothetical protein CDD82_454 [Ophiocordyceps australis]
MLRTERSGMYEMEYVSHKTPYVVAHSTILGAIRGWMLSPRHKNHARSPYIFEFETALYNQMIRRSLDGDEIWISLVLDWDAANLIRWALLPHFVNQPTEQLPKNLLQGFDRVGWMYRTPELNEYLSPQKRRARCDIEVSQALGPYLDAGSQGLAQRFPTFDLELRDLFCEASNFAASITPQQPQACEAALSRRIQPLLAASPQQQSGQLAPFQEAVKDIVCSQSQPMSSQVSEGQLLEELQRYINMPFDQICRMFPQLRLAMIQAIFDGLCTRLDPMRYRSRQRRHIIAPRPPSTDQPFLHAAP